MSASGPTAFRRSSTIVLVLLLALGSVVIDQSWSAQAQSSSGELQAARAERDRLQQELIARYRDGDASVDEIVPRTAG